MRELQKLLQSFRTDLMDDGHKDEDPIMEQYDHFTDDVVKLFAIADVVGQSEQLPDNGDSYNPLDDADDPRTMGLNNG